MIKSQSQGHEILYLKNEWVYADNNESISNDRLCKNCRKKHQILFINNRLRDIDNCIYPIVKALNDGGIKIVASCCGHGRIGNIALADDRELFIVRDFETARKVDKILRRIK